MATSTTTRATDAPGGYHLFTNAVFEESLCIDMSDSWKGVTSMRFNQANFMFGDIVWDEGVQFKVDIQGSDITLGARRNYGTPIDCEQFFDLVRDCDDIISYIDGASTTSSPGTFRFNSGNKVVLYEDATNHRIYVGLNFDTTDICEPVVNTPSPNVL